MPRGIYQHKTNQGFRKGHPTFISPEKYKEIGKKKMGNNNSSKRPEVRKKMSLFWKGKHISPKTEFKKGENHPKWQGGTRGNYLLTKREKIVGKKKPDQCEICGCFGRICFDHDHKTGKFRGWICQRCNFVLGHVKDNTETLIALIEYLRNSKKIS